MFAKWLSIITQKEINDKTIIEDICKEEEAIGVAVSTLARQGEDKYVRQAYQRRQDELYYYNKNMSERDEYKRQAEQERRRAGQERRRAEQEQRRAEIAENALEEKDAIIAQLRARLGEKLGYRYPSPIAPSIRPQCGAHYNRGRISSLAVFCFFSGADDYNEYNP